MSQRVDLSQYFTRRQSDQRFLKTPQVPQPPTSVMLATTGIISAGQEQYAYLDLSIIPPSVPSWFVGNQYIQGFKVSYSYTVQSVLVQRTLYLTYDVSNVYRVDPLPGGVAVDVSVKLIDYTGQLSTSTNNTLTTATDTVAPAKPAISAIVVDAGALIRVISVGGNPGIINQEPDFDHYALYRGQGPNSGAIVWESQPTVISFFADGAIDAAIPTSASDYWYRVAAIDSSGNIQYSDPAGPLILVATATPPPPAVSLIGASATSDTSGVITLSWTPLTFLGLASYRIWRARRISTGPDVFEPFQFLSQFAAASGLPNPVTYVDIFAVNGQNYIYTVTAVNGFGDESAFPSSPDYLQVTSVDSSAPNAVAGVVLTGRLGGVYAVWDISTSPDVIKYKINWRTSVSSGHPGTGWQAQDTIVVGNSFTILGQTTSRDLLANQFEVRVVAVDDVGNESTPTYYVALYPDLAGYSPADNTIPAAPLSVSAQTFQDGSVQLSWTASISSDRSGYQIEKYDSIDAAWEVVTTILNNNAGVITYRIQSLEPYEFRNKQYRFRVRTIDFSGNISPINLAENPSFENSLTGWTQAGVPVIVSSGARTGTKALRAGWNDNVSQSFLANPSDIFTVSGYVMTDSVVGSPALLLSYHDSGGFQIGVTLSTTITSTGAYQRVTATGAAPIGTVSVRIIVAGESANPTRTFIWDDVQIEQVAAASSWNDAKTGLINVADVTPPADYAGTISLSAVGGLGLIGLKWNNPVAASFDWVGGVFEVWRQITDAGGQPGLSVDGSFRKIQEVPANPDGAQVRYDDLEPEESYHVVASYKLFGRDRWGNRTAVALNGGTAVSATSKTPNDIAVAQKDGLVPSTSGTPTATANTDGSIGLQWSGSSTSGRNDLQGYRIYRRANAAGSYLICGFHFVLTDGGTINWTDGTVDLDGDNTYDYKIAAVDNAGEESTLSVASNSVTPTDDRTPVAPTSIVLRGYIGGIIVSWAPSTSRGVKKYKINVPALAGAGAFAMDAAGSEQYVRLTGGPTWAQIVAALSTFTVQSYSRVGVSLSTATAAGSATSQDSYLPMDSIAPDAPASLGSWSITNVERVSASMVKNGGGEIGSEGSQADNWILASGNGLLIVTDFFHSGLRSMKIVNASAADSYSYQDMTVETGHNYRLSGWIKTTALPTADAGWGAILNIEVVTGAVLSFISRIGGNPGGAAQAWDTGVAADGAVHDWTYVESQFSATTGGTIRLHSQLGFSGTQSGTAWFDDIKIEDLSVGGIVNVTTSAAHSLKAGDSVKALAVTNTGINGDFSVFESSTPTIFSYVQSGSALVYTSDTGSVVKTFDISNNQGGSIILMWGASGSQDAKFYEVAYSQETGESTGVEGAWIYWGSPPVPTTSAKITGLDPTIYTGKRFKFRVRTFDNSNNSSSFITGAWTSAAADTTAPAAPIGLSVTLVSEGGSATVAIAGISWSPNTDRDLFNYIVDFYRTDAVGGVTTRLIPPYVTSLTERGLTVGVQYSFRVRAVDSSGNRSAFSDPVLKTASAPAGGNVAPAAPTITAVTYDTANQRVSVTFTDNNTGGDTSYFSIRRSTVSGTEGPQVRTSAASPALDAYAQGSSSITLYYNVRCVDAGGLTSTASNQMSVVVPRVAPEPVDNPYCPTLETYVFDGKQVKDLKLGDPMLVLKNGLLCFKPILNISYAERECFEVYTDTGYAKEVSDTTPFILPDGSEVRAPQMEGQLVAVLIEEGKVFPSKPAPGAEYRRCQVHWDRSHVRPIGKRWVALIDLGGEVFAGGKDPGFLMFSHNLRYNKD